MARIELVRRVGQVRPGFRGMMGDDSFFNRMDRMFQDLTQDVFGTSLPNPMNMGLAFKPMCDVEETDKSYILNFDIPGVNKDDLTVEVSGNTLTVSGERRRKLEKMGMNMERGELSDSPLRNKSFERAEGDSLETNRSEKNMALNARADSNSRFDRTDSKMPDSKMPSARISERRYGQFTRVFSLPENVDSQRVEAEYEQGVLRLVVPKVSFAQRRKIAIKGADEQDNMMMGEHDAQSQLDNQNAQRTNPFSSPIGVPDLQNMPPVGDASSDQSEDQARVGRRSA